MSLSAGAGYDSDVIPGVPIDAEIWQDPSLLGRTVDITRPSGLTPEALVERCVKNDGYAVPELNEQLLLHHAGFSRIPEGILEPYYNCRTLYLQANGVQEIENIESLTLLTSLYLMENSIQIIKNVACFSELLVLNLSNNQITHVPSGCLPSRLQQFTISKNFIATIKDIPGIFECEHLNTLNISYNNIEETDEIIDLWEPLKLQCLILNHNPGIQKVKHYRKKIINAIPTLRFLDDRPVNDLERAGAEAWSRGEDEQAAKKVMWDKAEEQKRLSFERFRRIQEAAAKAGMERWEAERIEREQKEKEEAERQEIERIKKEEEERELALKFAPPKPKLHVPTSELDEMD